MVDEAIDLFQSNFKASIWTSHDLYLLQSVKVEVRTTTKIRGEIPYRQIQVLFSRYVYQARGSKLDTKRVKYAYNYVTRDVSVD